MITCKTCKKYAKLDKIIVNGLDEFLLIGSCKNCGYKQEPKLPKKYDGTIIKNLDSRIDYDDFDELGLDF